MRSRAINAAVVSLAVLGASAPGAAADGLPVSVEQTFGEGVVSADGSNRFVTIGAGDKTVVMRISTDGGDVADYTATDGLYTVPAIAVDGTASGVSADGETLALINPRKAFPRKTTRFQVYEADKLRKGPMNINLRGDFSFDALSPDGETMYLVEYTNPRDYDDYVVRSFDLASQELDPDPILDSEEDPDDMRGLPQTRATSPDGRWEYTLYDGGGGHPFIHALDVVDAATVCIDLEMLRSNQTHWANLVTSEDGASIELTDESGKPRALVDTATFEVTEPAAKKAPASSAAAAGGGALSPAGVAAGALLAMAVAGLAIRRMRN